MTATSRSRGRFAHGRHAGVLVPLFSCCSTRSWGVGEIGDIARVARWLRDAGQDLLQLLPVNEMSAGETSPYSAISALAVDPIYISLYAVEDFAALGGEAALPAWAASRLAAARGSSRILYQDVRHVKGWALRAAFARFMENEIARGTKRAASFDRYREREAWWLDGYAIYRALRHRFDERPWTDWPEGLRTRDRGAVARARRELAREIRFYEYVQWMADGQWQRARGDLGAVGLFGDLPFMVSLDSADVWWRQGEFLLDASVGVPPDAFSEDGQDWGLPGYRWDAQAGNAYEWLRQRARRAAALYDGYRVDHVVGFYRTYVRPLAGGAAYFTPAHEPAQIAQGERLLTLFRDSGATVIAEDLGTVPDGVRASLARLNVPGYRVLRWERQWHLPDQPFRDPATYPAASVATSGTHDTEPAACWWDDTDVEARRPLRSVPALRELSEDDLRGPFSPRVRDLMLDALFGSGSNLLLLPIQDVFGWRDRINVPARVSDENWTFRLPWPVDWMAAAPEVRERTAALRRWSERYGRAAAP